MKVIPVQQFGMKAPSTSAVTIAEPGGVVTTPSGKVISYAVAPTDDEIEPNHLYLLRLSEHSEGFFTIQDAWDLSTGKAVAITALAKFYEKSGKSVLAAKTQEDIGSVLRQHYKGQ